MNRKIISLICCFCFFVFIQNSFSQNQHKIDSLLNVLKTAKEDTNKANILNQLASLNTYNDPEKSFGYSSSALALAEKLGSKKYIFQSYQNMSVYYSNTGNPQLAVEYIKKSIPLIEEVGDRHNLADAYGNMSNGSYYLNDYYGAFTYSKKALEISEEIKDSSRIATWLNAIGNNYRDILTDYNTALNYLFRALNINLARKDNLALGYDYFNIAVVYSMEHNEDKAFEFYNLALNMAEQANDQIMAGDCTNGIGNVYFTKNNFVKSEEFYMKALKLCESIKSFSGILEANDGLAKVYSNTGKFDKAFECEDNVMKIAQQIGDKYSISTTNTSYSDIYSKMHSYKKANDYLKQGLTLANEIGRKDVQRDIYKKLAENSKLMNNYKAAYEYQNEYSKLNDSIAGEQILKKTAELQARFESEKKDNEITFLTKDKQIQNVEIKRQKFIKNSLTGGLALLLLLSILFYNYYRTKQLLKLQTLRNRIASDLHDDVGSTLSSISIFSELAKEQSKEVIPMLESIGESSRKMLDSMTDIVWTINPENDNFEKIILRMRSFAYELLGAKKIDFEFNADDAVAKMKLPMEVRKNLYLIFKEATNNMVKYADADRAFFSVTGTKGNLTMLIRDNGRGFDTNKSSEGNGLKNMKKRAQEIGAKLLIESGAGIGTTIQFSLKTA